MATEFPTFTDVPEGTTPGPGTPDVDAAYLNAVSGAVNTLENTLPGLVNAADLADVATSGSYTDLIGQPFIPAEAADIGAQPAGSYATVTQLNGKANASHTHPTSQIAATGTPSGTTFLRGDGAWAVPTGSGTTDHGALTGLADDDHSQYHNDTRGDARYYTRAQVDTTVSGLVPTTRGLVAGTGLTGGGTLDADRTLAVVYGLTAGTAVQGSIVDAANGVAPLDANQRVPSNRMPRVPTVVRDVAYAASITLDPTVNGNAINIVATGNITSLGASTTGVAGRQVLRVAVYASAGTRTVTFSSSIRTSTSLTRGPYTIATGEVLLAAIEFMYLNVPAGVFTTSPWVLTAATVSAV